MVLLTHPPYLRPYHQRPLNLPLRQPHPHHNLHLLNSVFYYVPFIRIGPQVTSHRDPSQDADFIANDISPAAAYDFCTGCSVNG